VGIVTGSGSERPGGRHAARARSMGADACDRPGGMRRRRRTHLSLGTYMLLTTKQGLRCCRSFRRCATGAPLRCKAPDGARAVGAAGRSSIFVCCFCGAMIWFCEGGEGGKRTHQARVNASQKQVPGSFTLQLRSVRTVAFLSS